MQDEKWINVSERKIQLPIKKNEGAQLKWPERGRKVTPLHLFQAMLSHSIISHIVECTYKGKYNDKHPPTEADQRTMTGRMMRYIAYIIKLCTLGKVNMRKNLDGGDGKIISRAVYAHLRQHLNADLVYVITELNKALHGLIKVKCYIVLLLL